MLGDSGDRFPMQYPEDKISQSRVSNIHFQRQCPLGLILLILHRSQRSSNFAGKALVLVQLLIFEQSIERCRDKKSSIVLIDRSKHGNEETVSDPQLFLTFQSSLSNLTDSANL